MHHTGGNLDAWPDGAGLMDLDIEPQTKGQEEGDTSELSPVKKRSKGKRNTSSRPRSTSANPTSTNKANSTTNAKSATFLDEVVYPHSRVIIELAIMLKSDKAFEEFTQALMAFITTTRRWSTPGL